MALDLHAGAIDEEASRAARLASIDFEAHRELFHLRLLRDEECPLLKRMKDFNADAVYSGIELERLASEVEAVAVRVNPILAGVLRQVGAAAQLARREGLNLYAFCD